MKGLKYFTCYKQIIVTLYLWIRYCGVYLYISYCSIDAWKSHDHVLETNFSQNFICFFPHVLFSLNFFHFLPPPPASSVSDLLFRACQSAVQLPLRILQCHRLLQHEWTSTKVSVLSTVLKREVPRTPSTLEVCLRD